MAYTDNIRRVTPYTPGEQPVVTGELIKLNTNENPYGPSPKVREAVDSLPLDEMRLYPNVTAAPLARALAEYHGLNENQVFVGVGSDDVLANCFLTYFAGEKPILFPDITYSFYDVWADLYRIPYQRVPLGENFVIQPQDYLQANGGIVIANPNAPTSVALPLDAIERIVSTNPDSVVIVDEAYVDFGGETAIPLLEKYDNLVVVRTFSKSRSFAGMRIGYAMASEELIGYLNDVKFSINSYTMSCAAIKYGIASVEDDAYFKDVIARVVDTRAWAVTELEQLGFTCLPSSANFLFVTHKTAAAEDIFNYLKTRQIFVRYFKKPRIDNYLRITVGTQEQMQKLIDVLAGYLNK